MKYYFLKNYKGNKVNDVCVTPPIELEEKNLPRYHITKINKLLEKNIIGTKKKIINKSKNK